MSPIPKNAPVPSEAAAPADRGKEVRKLVVTIACEVVNPLASVVGYADLLEATLNDPAGSREQCLEYLHKLRDHSKKAQKKIAELSQLAQVPLDDAEVERFLMEASTRDHSTTPTPGKASVTMMPERAPAAAAPRRVLIVQPSEAMMEFKRLLLATLGAEVICANGGARAMEILQNEHVDGIVLDDEDEVHAEWTSALIFDWIAQHRPELARNVLWTVAMHPAPAIYSIVRRPGVRHMTKPLQMEPLLAAMQQMLRGHLVH